MSPARELAVTLSPSLYDLLVAEANLLDVPLEWLVASLVFDSMENDDLTPLAG